MRRRNAFLFLVGMFLCLEITVLAQNSLPKLAVLDRAGMERLEAESVTGQLNLLWIRADTSLLDTDKMLQRSFAVLNNCLSRQGRFAIDALDNEFDYPQIIAFYKPKAPEILKLVSNTTTITADEFIAGSGSSMLYALGQYDMAANAFPFVDPSRMTKLQSPITLNGFAAHDGSPGPCRSPLNVKYSVTFPDVRFSELRMDEQAARNLVSSLPDSRGGPRPISVQLDVEILPEAPQVSKDRVPVVTFHAKVTKVTAVRPNDGRPLAVLYP